MIDPIIDWTGIETILLDMDGTLLDLHFDEYFWREHVPQRYAQKFGLDLEDAKSKLFELYKEIEGSLEWYCVDYWSSELDLDIPILKEEIDHLIRVHPYVVEFLGKMRRLGKRTVLVTNAHGKSLSLKMKRTQLGRHLDRTVCAHDLGLPKEDVKFWDELKSVEPFDEASALLIDDSIPVLESARRYGFSFLLAVKRPNTRKPARTVKGFSAIHTFAEIMPD